MGSSPLKRNCLGMRACFRGSLSVRTCCSMCLRLWSACTKSSSVTSGDQSNARSKILTQIVLLLEIHFLFARVHLKLVFGRGSSNFWSRYTSCPSLPGFESACATSQHSSFTACSCGTDWRCATTTGASSKYCLRGLRRFWKSTSIVFNASWSPTGTHFHRSARSCALSRKAIPAGCPGATPVF